LIKITSDSEETTKNIAAKLAEKLEAGDVVCLFGNLGAGKTVFASGFAKGLGINSPISSPTFIIVNEYEGKLPLFHFDVYRIDSDEFLEMGGDEYFSRGGICLIEWPENITDVLPKERLEIYIDYADDTTREIVIKPIGERYERLMQD